MALLKFDLNRIEVDLVIGALESYKPDQGVRDIIKKSGVVKKSFQDKVMEITGKSTVKATEAQKIFDSSDEKKALWVEYLSKEFSEDVRDLQGMIFKKNEEICEGFREHMQKRKDDLKK